ncbi:MAG: DoxX family protein [Candidatus Acidiferrales bacterium]
METLEKLKPLGLLLLRLALGVIFVYHGYPKLANPQEYVHAFKGMGFPGYFAYIAGIIETFGGGLLILGLFTRIAGLAIAGEMAVALWRVHDIISAPMAVNNYQFPLALAAGAFALATTGAGTISLDHAIFRGGRGAGKSARKSRD